MTDEHPGASLLTIFVQLTPWVQAVVAFLACVLALGLAYLFKETVAALTHPFIRPPPGQGAQQGAFVRTVKEVHDD
ncbi:MAG: hypothetical protein ACOYJQ_01300 [Pseudochelatococcus sp.]|jgi:hypothetical protein|uniref:hypothetical protein n=1 Tax=Pseudochelatococcus sp. TaxID=2020869 RepID=UPI003D8C8A35